jgi:hypothetical protein
MCTDISQQRAASTIMPIRLHGVTYHKTVILTVTSDVTIELRSPCHTPRPVLRRDSGHVTDVGYAND